MAQFLGQIPEEVDALAAKFGQKADEIDHIISEITSQLGSTSWVGADRNRFESDWNGQLTSHLRHVGDQLRHTQQLAAQNANEQRNASA